MYLIRFKKQERVGEWLMLIIVFMHGFWPIGMNFGAKHMPQIQFLAYITGMGIPLFFAFAFFRKTLHQLWNTPVLIWLSVYTILIAVLPYGVITYATRYSSAIDTALLTQTEVIFAALLGWFLLKEKLELNRVLGVGFIFIANVFVLAKGEIAFNVANVAIALAPLSFVFANILIKQLQQQGLDWAPLLFYRATLSTVILLLIAHGIEGLQVPPRHFWIFLLSFGLLLFGFRVILWQLALQRLDVSKITALGMTYPVLSFCFAYVLRYESPTLYQWMALGWVCIGVGFLLRTTSQQSEVVFGSLVLRPRPRQDKHRY